MQYMSMDRLKKIRSHAEYGCKFIADLTENDLSHDGDWLGSFSDLKTDISMRGIVSPLIIDKYDSGEMTLGNGHHRAVIAMQLNIDYVPVEVRG